MKFPPNGELTGLIDIIKKWATSNNYVVSSIKFLVINNNIIKWEMVDSTFIYKLRIVNNFLVTDN